MDDYRPRVFEPILMEKLEAMGVVVIEGPKYCGKTTLARQFAGSVLFMADPETKEQNMTLAKTNVSRLLQGETPRLLDEWQLSPNLWDAVRNEVDRRNKDGQFILTGSAVPPDTADIFHTGTGRMSWIKLRTMSLWESGESTGDVSLGQLFKAGGTAAVDGESHIDLEQLAFLVCRGGW
ncbi:MAG: AAA family ATPase, partial [Bacteroidales bacterium]|nr:AAA family ATPase [Bacteroidales bacterium]